MKALGAIASLVILHVAAKAQCDVVIPATVTNVVVGWNGPAYVGGQHFWVCPGAICSITYNGGNTIYMQPEAIFVTGTSNNTIIAKSGCIIELFATGNTIYLEPNVTIYDVGGTTLVPCASVEFDGSNTLGQGCITPISIDERSLVTRVSIHMDPGGDRLMLIVPDGLQIQSLRAADVHGRMAFDRPLADTSPIDVSSLTPGIYVLVLRTSAGEFRTRVFKP